MSVVSWYTPTIRRFSDPSKHARLYYTLRPLFPADDPLFTSKEKQYSRIHRQTKKWAQKGNIVAGVRTFHLYHQLLKPELKKLAGKKVIFLPGVTIDNAISNPKYICVDYACERNRLTEEILLGIRELTIEYGWDMHDDVHFIQVSPVVLPFHATPDNKLVHSLDDVIQRTAEDTKELHMFPLGNTERDPLSNEFRQGILQYSLGIFDSSIAKEAQGKALAKKTDKLRRGFSLPRKDREDLVRLFGSDRDLATLTKGENIDPLLEKACAYNRQLMATAYATVCDELKLDKIVYYGPRTSVELGIIMSAAKILSIPVDAWGNPDAETKPLRGKGTMKNAKLNTLSSAAYPAIRRLKGKLYRWQKEKLGKHPEKTHSLPPTRQHVPCFGLPKPCPDLAGYRCPYAQKEDNRCGAKTDSKTPIGCAYDFAKNRFTKKDIEEILQEKYGKTSPEQAKKLYEELKNKKVRYLDEQGKVREATELEILQEDLCEQGWTFTWIEEDIRLLQEKDAFISKLREKGGFLTRSWQRFLGDKRLYCRLGIDLPAYELKPLIIPCSTPKTWSVRPSEFSSECYIARMLSKIDKAKLPEEILPHKWAVAGTARHRLALWRPWKEYHGKKATPFWQYTERELWASFNNISIDSSELENIVVFGHADALLLLTNGTEEDDIPVILDYKRSPNEKPSYTVQEELYKLGAQRASTRNFTRGAVLIVVNRPHFADPDEQKFPVYHIVYDDGTGDQILPFTDTDPFTNTKVSVHGIDELVIRNYKIQHQLLNREAFLEAREKAHSKEGPCHNPRKPGTCGHPFNKQLCSCVARLIEKGEPIQKYFLEGVRL
ncbi:MAG: hypothetical protein QXM31_02660 [Candidatus Woesearchaeota archaeon]